MKHIASGLLAFILIGGASAVWAQDKQTEASSETPHKTYPEYTRGNCDDLKTWQNKLNGYTAGQVAIDCAVAMDGHLTSCQVISESFSALGSGKAMANVFMCQARVDDASIPGGITEGTRHKFKLKFGV